MFHTVQELIAAYQAETGMKLELSNDKCLGAQMYNVLTPTGMKFMQVAIGQNFDGLYTFTTETNTNNHQILREISRRKQTKVVKVRFDVTFETGLIVSKHASKQEVQELLPTLISYVNVPESQNVKYVRDSFKPKFDPNTENYTIFDEEDQ